MVITEDISLRDANMRVELLNLDIEKLYERREFLFNKTQPKPLPITNERTQGGTREDKFLLYNVKVDEENIDYRIECLIEERNILVDYINKRLKILGKYGKVEQLVIYYKESYTKKDGRALSWQEIADKVFYSKTQCRNIYRVYKQIRNIDT